MLNTQSGFPSSPPAFIAWLQTGTHHKTTELLENLMSFLQQSDLKKHLSTKSGNMTNHKESPPTQGSRVILRDGNLITLPPSILEEGSPEIDRR
jgi:hypothetical protein